MLPKLRPSARVTMAGFSIPFSSTARVWSAVLTMSAVGCVADCRWLCAEPTKDAPEPDRSGRSFDAQKNSLKGAIVRCSGITRMG